MIHVAALLLGWAGIWLFEPLIHAIRELRNEGKGVIASIVAGILFVAVFLATAWLLSFGLHGLAASLSGATQ